MQELIDILENFFKNISKLLRENNTINLAKVRDKDNKSGDAVKEIDDLSNSILKTALAKCSLIRTIGSEEEDTLYPTQYKKAPYLICYDPLDGSSNVDINITTGTIFALYQYDTDGSIKNGRNIAMSGYCLYGGSCQYLLAYDNNVSVKQYSSLRDSFFTIVDKLTIPKKGMYYSINSSNKNKWDDKYNIYLNELLEEGYNMRWIGSLVADAHRTLFRGGIFLYPGNKKSPKGKIRLLYEAYPFAHIFTMAGGRATNGEVDLLDVVYPNNIHEKTPIILGSVYEVDKLLLF